MEKSTTRTIDDLSMSTRCWLTLPLRMQKEIAEQIV
jgi:hypothetical protein